MDSLKTILKDSARWYAGGGANIRLFAALDDENQVYAVNAVDYPERKKAGGVVVLARLVGDVVVIEEDRTDRPLLERLMAEGIPRQQIIAAYAGEAIPDPV